MLEKILRRLCPCYWWQTDETELLCSDGPNTTCPIVSRQIFLCSEKNDSAGFEVNSSKGKEEAEAPWKGTLNIVRPQPMYAIPYDIQEGLWGSKKHLAKPVLCWKKAMKNLPPKGPTVYQKSKKRKKNKTSSKTQAPIKSSSEIISLRNFDSSKGNNKATELVWFKSKSFHNISLDTISSKKLLKELNVKENYRGAGDLCNDDKWYFVEDFKVYPDVSHGVVLFTAVFFQKRKLFLINVHRLENLSRKGKEGSPYSSVLKASILPSEKYLKCSKILERSTEPQVKEDFSFPLKDLTGKVLRLSVFDVSFQKRHDAVGHAILQLEDAASGLPKKYKIKLYRRSQPHVAPGNLFVSLTYKPDDRKFFVIVDKARNLKLQTDRYVKLNTYVKASLYFYGEKIKSKKSLVAPDSSDPNYNSSFTFDVGDNHVDHLSVVIAVKLKSFVKDITIGHVILGPFFVEEKQKLTPWGRIFLKKESVSHWFRLYL